VTRTAAVLILAAGAGPGLAQPAARLLPARTTDPVARGTAPEAEARKPAPPPERRSLIGGPTSPARPAQSPTIPPYLSGQSGVFAGPPAWKWYGYGTTTPGGNPLAPAGQYPKASANWYAQTGATPGAFPVPVSAGGEPVGRFDPPAYAGAAPPPLDPPVRPRRAEPPTVAPPRALTAVPPPAVNVRVAPPPPLPTAEPTPIAVSSPAVAAPVPTTPAQLPVIAAPTPTAQVTVLATPPPAAEPPAPAPVPPAPPAPAVAWQSAGTPAAGPTFTAAPPVIAATPPPAAEPPAPLPVPPAPVFQPVPFAAPSVAPPPPAPPVSADWKPVGRGQLPTAPAVGLGPQVRNACYGLAAAEVTHTGPSSLTVKLTAATEADGRAAAAAVAKLPALKPYDVRFVLTASGR
jgi:hypothetical protein